MAPIIERIVSGSASNLMRVLIRLTAPSEAPPISSGSFGRVALLDMDKNLAIIRTLKRLHSVK